ncbi:MAG: alpha/beta hydrolase [Candidatus Bipolaricaulota bacterium]|nr:alpha/beta hydrolase [Candidatus Bipolaricaulota bacterium]
MTERGFLTVRGVRLSWLDFGGDGDPLLALHGHYSCARTFAGLAHALAGRWRVVALDQRGHGWSDVPDDYSRQAYVDDTAAVIERLRLAPAVVLGHSLGGVNAYQLAARRPDLVRALIVEDVGTDTRSVPDFVPDWPDRFESMRAVLAYSKERGWIVDPYFLENLVEYEDGRGFRFDRAAMQSSQRLVEGDWWSDWLASSCPVLLLHGHKSWVLQTRDAREMAVRRPNVRLVEFPDCGHTIHDERPEEFDRAVSDFLAALEA